MHQTLPQLSAVLPAASYHMANSPLQNVRSCPRRLRRPVQLIDCLFIGAMWVCTEEEVNVTLSGKLSVVVRGPLADWMKVKH